MSVWSRGRHFRVGLLAVVSAALMVATVLFLIGAGAGARQLEYQIEFHENTKGMQVGSRVNFQGVPVGAVADMRFEAGKTLVRIAVDPERCVVQDVTRARMDRLLVTGQVTVELEGWSRAGRALPDGAMIAAKESPMDRLAKTLPELMQQADHLLDQWLVSSQAMNALLSEANRRRVDAILAHAEQASATLPGELAATLQESRAALAEARAALARTAGLERRLDLLAGEAHGALANSRAPLLEVLHALRDSLAEVQRLARHLRLAPSSVLFGTTVKDLEIAPAPPGGGR